MSELLDKIQAAQVRAGEQAVVEHLASILQPPTTLWAVHVEGPDDLYAAPSKAEADAACVLFNAAWDRSSAPKDVLCRAVTTPWPYAAEEHAKYPDDIKALLL